VSQRGFIIGFRKENRIMKYWICKKCLAWNLKSEVCFMCEEPKEVEE